MNLLDAALSYARRGWPVIPLWWTDGSACGCRRPACSDQGKHPLGEAVPHGLKDATTDEGVIRAWWSRFPRANIGLVTGARAGFDVADLDVHGESNGVETFDRLEAEHGPLGGPVAATGGGGFHRLFRHRDGLKNSAGRLPGVDVRADGGYIVAPPSMHRSGRRYEWVAERSHDEVDLCECPEWLVDKLRRPAATVRAPVPALASGVEKHGGARLLQILHDDVATAKPGGRDETRNAVAFRAGRFVAAGRFTREEAIEAVVGACVANGLAEEEGEGRLRARTTSGVDDGIEAGPTDGMVERANHYASGAANGNAASGPSSPAAIDSGDGAKDAARRVDPSVDREAEIALLACRLRDPVATAKACDAAGGVVSSDLRAPGTREVWRACDAIVAAGGKVEAVAVRAEVAKRSEPTALDDVLAAVPTVAVENASIYAKRVRDLALAEHLSRRLDQVRELAERGGPGALAAIEVACVAHREQFASVAAAPAFGWVTSPELLAEPEHEVEFLWWPLVARSCMTLFAAGAKGGKTWLLFSRLGAMSRREPFLGRSPLDYIPRVLLVSEEPRWVVQKRLRQFGVTNVDVLTLDAMPAGTTWPALLEESGRYAGEVDADWIIYDTVSTLAAIADENDAAAVNAAVVAASRLARHSRRAVTLVHHFGRNDGIRGSTAFDAVPDCLVEVKTVGREDSKRRAMRVRGRLPDRPDAPIVVEWEQGQDGRPDTHRLVSTSSPADEKADRERQRVVTVHGRILRILDDAAAAWRKDPARYPWLTLGELGEHLGSSSDAREQTPTMADAGRIQREPRLRGFGYLYALTGVPTPRALAAAAEAAAAAAEASEKAAAQTAPDSSLGARGTTDPSRDDSEGSSQNPSPRVPSRPRTKAKPRKSRKNQGSQATRTKSSRGRPEVVPGSLVEPERSRPEVGPPLEGAPNGDESADAARATTKASDRR